MTVLRMAAIVPKALNACALVILPTTSKSLCVRLIHRVLSAFRRTSSVRESFRQAVTSGPSSRTSFSFRLITTCSISTMPLPFCDWRLYIVRAIYISHVRWSIFVRFGFGLVKGEVFYGHQIHRPSCSTTGGSDALRGFRDRPVRLKQSPPNAAASVGPQYAASIYFLASTQEWPRKEHLYSPKRRAPVNTPRRHRMANGGPIEGGRLRACCDR